MWLWPKRSRVPEEPVGQILSLDARQLAVIDLGSSLSSDASMLINRNILTHGEPFRSGGELGIACLPVLGFGSVALSSLAAGNLFMATANPSTLMAIRGGLGSAVIGESGKIIAHAPFVAASKAIVPVILPLVLFMTVSAVMLSHRFNRVEASLEKLAMAVAQVLKRDIAEDYGQTLSAVDRLRDISSEFAGSRRFSQEMKIRLALVERDLSDVHHKYNLLVDSPLSERGDMEMAPVNQHLFMLAAIGSIITDRVRLWLALQDNPDDLERSVNALREKTEVTQNQFAKLLKDNPTVQYHRQLQDSLGQMSWLQRNIFGRSRRKALEDAERKALEIRAEDLTPVLNTMQSWSDKLSPSDEEAQQVVVFFREDGGKGKLRAYYTSDWQFVSPRQVSSGH